MDYTRATELTTDVKKALAEMFTAKVWNVEQFEKGSKVTAVLLEAMYTVVENVPPSPDRSSAMRKIREAMMDCFSAISYDGKY